jgi:hypothetical protein
MGTDYLPVEGGKAFMPPGLHDAVQNAPVLPMADLQALLDDISRHHDRIIHHSCSYSCTDLPFCLDEL